MSATAQAIVALEPIHLAGLRRLTFAQLEDLYRQAKPPAQLSDLDGDATGAMLALRSPARGPLAWWLRTFGASGAFPWRGKSFQANDAKAGQGINRINFFGGRRWFPFKTRFDVSFIDGRPAFVLDYSDPGNPPLIRSIVDEVREVAPGLYLGPAALLVKGRPRPILFFAVEVSGGA